MLSPLPEPKSAPTLRSAVLRAVLWGAVYLGAAYFARLSTDDAGLLTLVAPGAGVSVLWFVTGSRRTWPVDLLVLAATSTVLVLTVYDEPWLVPVSFMGAVAQVAGFQVALATVAPGFWGRRRTAPLTRAEDLLALLAASVVGAFLGAVVSTVGFHLVLNEPFLPDLVVRTGRNATAMFVAVAVAATVPTRMRALAPHPSTVPDLVRELAAAARRRGAEAGLLMLVTVAVFWAGFGSTRATPIGFLLLVPAIWVGMRFAPAAGAWFGLTSSVVVVGFTLTGRGVFVTIQDPAVRALVAQLLVATLVGITLLLALTRAALAEALATLAERGLVMDLALQTMDEGFAIFDADGRVLERNAAAGQLLGRPDERSWMRPVGPYGLFHADGRPMRDGQTPHERALAGAEIEAEEYHLRRADAPLRILEITSRRLPLPDPTASPRVVSLVRDVTTDRRETEMLTAFAGVVAHDLNNPLTVVSGWAEALLDELERSGAVAEDVGLPMVTKIHSAATHMRSLISDLLGYATASNKVPEPRTVSLGASVERALTLRDAPGDGHAPTVVAEDLGDVWADPLLLLQLLDNLIGNAAKYVAPGTVPHIVVASARLPEHVEVTVADNGIGIPASERELVFETFHRAHTSGFSGTGLGLAICKRIVEAHGGRITAEANPAGQGSVIRFTLPVAPGESPSVAAPLRRVPAA